MTITEDVVIDLLPIYWANEAGSATVKLVDAYLELNPSFNAIAVSMRPSELPSLTQLPQLPEIEMASLKNTKRLISQRQTLIALALFFTGMCSAFQFDSNGFQWFWSETPALGAIFLALGVAAWIGLFTVMRQLKRFEL